MRFSIFMALFVASYAYGQTEVDREIQLASEAAPSHISEAASFMTFKINLNAADL